MFPKQRIERRETYTLATDVQIIPLGVLVKAVGILIIDEGDRADAIMGTEENVKEWAAADNSSDITKGSHLVKVSKLDGAPRNLLQLAWLIILHVCILILIQSVALSIMWVIMIVGLIQIIDIIIVVVAVVLVVGIVVALSAFSVVTIIARGGGWSAKGQARGCGSWGVDVAGGSVQASLLGIEVFSGLGIVGQGLGSRLGALLWACLVESVGVLGLSLCKKNLYIQLASAEHVSSLGRCLALIVASVMPPL